MQYLEFDTENSALSKAERKQLHNDEERQALLDHSVASAKGGGGPQARSLAAQEQEGKKFDSSKDAFNVNNKHENLFCCGRKGVGYLIINCTQFLYILTILYLSLRFVTLGPSINSNPEDMGKLIVMIVIMLFALALLIYAWFVIIPDILRSYTLTTSIEMMKDRDVINKVIGL